MRGIKGTGGGGGFSFSGSRCHSEEELNSRF